MSDYISREEAKRRLRMWITGCEMDGDKDAANHFRDCIDLLDELPAADPLSGKALQTLREDFMANYPNAILDEFGYPNDTCPAALLGASCPYTDKPTCMCCPIWDKPAK